MTSYDPTAAPHVEFIVPESEDMGAGSKKCLCCDKLRPASYMDEDGCGICEECLSP
jgi:hypothetical protein